MMMAPLEASDPDGAAAAAPVNTVMDSMSSGLKSWPREEKSRLRTEYESPPAPAILIGSNVLLFMGTPSTTYRGWLLPDMEVMLRSTTVVEAPGAPLVDVTFNPGTRPASAVMKASRSDSLIVLPSMCCTDEPMAPPGRFMPNSAVTATSPKSRTLGTMVTARV